MKYMHLDKEIAARNSQVRNSSISANSIHNYNSGSNVSTLAYPKKKSKSRVMGSIVLFVLLLTIIYVFRDGISKAFDPKSIVVDAATSGLKDTDGRVNVLLLGSDKRISDTRSGELTDTILVASIGIVEGNIVLISLPRDLWVEAKNANGQTFQSKINSVYAFGGAEELGNTVENVLGIPIHYYAVINFEVFKEAIDILGGVEVHVENAFTDYEYPVEGMESATNLADRYETVHFDDGVQIMDGETALKYVRSRHGDNGEGTDFARSRRQQKVIAAIKQKVLTLETLVSLEKIIELYKAYAANVDTNVSLKDVDGFYFLATTIDFHNMKSIVLDDRSTADAGGLLYSPEDTTLYGGAYVLLPQSGDFNQIHAYVQRYLFSAE